ncbi:MAG: hypothetical protein WAN10_02980 [Candidatus Acidiferrales bacterium]
MLGEAASLETLSLGVEANQGIEDCQHMAPVFGDTFEGNPLFGLAHAFAIPFCQHCGRNFDIAAQFFGRVPAEKQTIEKRGLPLRELKLAERVLNGAR